MNENITPTIMVNTIPSNTWIMGLVKSIAEKISVISPEEIALDKTNAATLTQLIIVEMVFSLHFFSMTL